MQKVLSFTEFDIIDESRLYEESTESIKAIQQALKAKGYGQLLGNSGPNGDGVDGQFGPRTITAIKKFQTDNGIQATGFVGKVTAPKLGVSPMTAATKPVQAKAKPGQAQQTKPAEPTKLDLTPKPYVQQADTFSPYAKNDTITKATTDSIEKFFKGLVTSYSNPLGIASHVRAFLEYLKGRTEPYGAEDFTKDELKTLLAMIKASGKVAQSGGRIDFYKAANKLNGSAEMIKWGEDNFGLDQAHLQTIPMKLAMTLGMATIKPIPNGYRVTDTYDFNNYQNNPEKYAIQEFPRTVADSVKKIFSGNFVQGLEQLASYKQKFGYNGFPIDIRIPTNLQA